MARLLLLGYRFGDRDEDVDSQESDTVLVVCGEVLEEGNHLFDDNGRRHGLDELGEVVCRLSPDHGGFIVNQLGVMLPELLLVLRARVLIRYVVKASGRNL